MRRYAWLIAGLLLLAWWAWSQHAPAPVATAPPGAAQDAATRAPGALPPGDATRAPPPVAARDYPAWLPREALDTLRLIERGGPYPYRQDGGVFGNRERLLPPRPRGYYREYTVRTPGARDRGARRIVAGGGTPDGSRPVEFFYTGDHYRSFRRFTPAQVRQ